MNGYDYTRQLKVRIAESPTHTLDLSDAIDFISFYGLRNLFNAQGDIRFVGQVAIDVLDKAISNNEICRSVKSEKIIESTVSTRLPIYSEWQDRMVKNDYV